MKIAIITGASSGMGKEFALQMAATDSSLDELWLIGRSEQKLNEVKKQISIRTRCLSIDLETKAGLQCLQTILKQEKPAVRLVVNAAGAGYIGRFEELTLEEHSRTTRLNAEALMSVTWMCLPYIKSGGRLVMLCSASAFAAQPGFSVYAASKAYVERFSRALRLELKPRKISVTLVCPGPVATPFFDGAARLHAMPEYKKAAMAQPAAVVHKALVDAYRRKSYSIYGMPMKAFYCAAKILPQELIMTASELLTIKKEN